MKKEESLLDATRLGITQLISSWQTLTNSTCIIYWSSGERGRLLNIDDAEILVKLLATKNALKRTDLIINSDGGLVAGAHRFIGALRSKSTSISAYVPRRARSAATVLCLGANEIVMGPIGCLSPIDPSIRYYRKGDANLPDRISSEELNELSKLYIGPSSLTECGEQPESRQQLLSLLSDRLFPTVIASFSRAERYTKLIAKELLAKHICSSDECKAEQIVNSLLGLYPDHRHCFDTAQLKAIGLPARDATNAECELMEQAVGICEEAFCRVNRTIEVHNEQCTGIMASDSATAIWTEPTPQVSSTSSDDVRAKPLFADRRPRWQYLPRT